MKRLLFLLSMFVAAASAVAQQFPTLENTAAVGPRDVLEIKVIEDPQISGRVTISSEGEIVLNVVGRVDVRGMTAPQIEARLKSLLEEKYITRATVSVQVVEYGNRPISVVGAVKSPGRIGATGNISLIQAISQAGGLTDSAGKELIVLRTGQNGLTEQLAINIDELMVAGNPDLNIPLAPNDLVNVPLDTPINIYVFGEVMRPGMIPFRRSATPMLLQAIAAAGGPTDRAGREIKVTRRENGKEVILKKNYRRILDGKESDLVLLDGDTVFIEESFF